MKTILLAVGLALSANAVNAAIINFNDTAPAPPPGYTYYANGSYNELGYSFSATGGSNLFTIDALYGASLGLPGDFPAADGTDFAYITGGAMSATLSANSTPFSLDTFQAAIVYNAAGFASGGNLVVTGTTSGGTVFTDTFVTANNKIWSTFTVGWTDLVEVSIVSDTNNIGFDNFAVDGGGTTPVPVPAAVWLFASGLASFRLFKKRQQA